MPACTLIRYAITLRKPKATEPTRHADVEIWWRVSAFSIAREGSMDTMTIVAISAALLSMAVALLPIGKAEDGAGGAKKES